LVGFIVFFNELLVVDKIGNLFLRVGLGLWNLEEILILEFGDIVSCEEEDIERRRGGYAVGMWRENVLSPA